LLLALLAHWPNRRNSDQQALTNACTQTDNPYTSLGLKRNLTGAAARELRKRLPR
jgi:hypothetical protein